MPYGRSDLEQSILDHRKIARTAIQLKHRIEADHELNRVMPVIEARLSKQLASGRIEPMSIDDMLRIADEASE